MVRTEERSIYTPSEKSNRSDLRRKSRRRSRDFRLQQKTLFTTSQKSMGESQCRNSWQTSGLPTIGTPDVRRDFRRAQLNKQPAPLMLRLPARVRSVSELPANVGTSDVHRQRASQKYRCWDSWLRSGLPTYVRTSDTESHRK